ncbi:MAG: hypothetical protein WKF30_11460 [Pyrinomonadaceae bacterium]
MTSTGDEEMPVDHKQESANLILKLYELRREEVLRQARSWFMGFTPASLEDFQQVSADMQTGAYYRMVTTYWDMAASLVNNGAIDEQMFNDANMDMWRFLAKFIRSSNNCAPRRRGLITCGTLSKW